MASRSSDSRTVRNRILDAAAAEFTRKGFNKTTVDDIARAVGATKGLIYYYFSSKFDIFLAGYEHGMFMVKDSVEPFADSPGTGRERLKRMADAHVLNLMQNPSYHNLIHQGVRDQDSASLTERQRGSLGELNLLRRDYEAMFRRVLELGAADGTLKTVDPALGARVLLSSLNAVDMWYRKNEKQTDEDLRKMAQSITSLVLTGVA